MNMHIHIVQALRDGFYVIIIDVLFCSACHRIMMLQDSEGFLQLGQFTQQLIFVRVDILAGLGDQIISEELMNHLGVPTGVASYTLDGHSAGEVSRPITIGYVSIGEEIIIFGRVSLCLSMHRLHINSWS